MKNGMYVFIFIFLCFPLFADVSVDVEVEGYNEPILNLEVSKKHIDFGPVNPELKEKEYNNAVEIIVKANVDWELTVEMVEDLVNENGYKLPDGRLMYRSLSPVYKKLYVGDPMLLSKGGPTGENGKVIPIDMKMKVEWGDEAGTYRTVLRYTLSPQP